jgi:hypothetical protein
MGVLQLKFCIKIPKRKNVERKSYSKTTFLPILSNTGLQILAGDSRRIGFYVRQIGSANMVILDRPISSSANDGIQIPIADPDFFTVGTIGDCIKLQWYAFNGGVNANLIIIEFLEF